MVNRLISGIVLLTLLSGCVETPAPEQSGNTRPQEVTKPDTKSGRTGGVAK